MFFKFQKLYCILNLYFQYIQVMDKNLQFMIVSKIHKRRLFLDGFG
jgi:hypothetical protein